MKCYKIIKTVFYLSLSILIFIFKNQLLENYIAYVVGGLMGLYGLDILLSRIVGKNLFKSIHTFIKMLLLFLLSVITILSKDEFVVVCVIWSMWSILRENDELYEIVHDIKEGNPFILNGLESIVCIAFSAMLILNPHPEHAYYHMILLSVELIGNVLFPHLKYVVTYKKENKQTI